MLVGRRQGGRIAVIGDLLGPRFGNPAGIQHSILQLAQVHRIGRLGAIGHVDDLPLGTCAADRHRIVAIGHRVGAQRHAVFGLGNGTGADRSAAITDSLRTAAKSGRTVAASICRIFHIDEAIPVAVVQASHRNAAASLGP